MSEVKAWAYPDGVQTGSRKSRGPDEVRGQVVATVETGGGDERAASLPEEGPRWGAACMKTSRGRQRRRRSRQQEEEGGGLFTMCV